MSALLYSTYLQWKLDLRSRTMLISCYAVPLVFFAFMGGVFTSVMPGYEQVLIPSMTVFAVSMGALIGLPPTLAEVYGTDVRKAYEANGVPLAAGLAASCLSAFVHLIIMSCILYALAPAMFDAALPADPGGYFLALAVFTAASLGYAGIIGLVVKDPSIVPMVSILVFLPSIMLSGIMFPAEFLPEGFRAMGVVFPASWGYLLMGADTFEWNNLWPLLVMCAACVPGMALLLRRSASR